MLTGLAYLGEDPDLKNEPDARVLQGGMTFNEMRELA
jgi:hypothetical protein